MLEHLRSGTVERVADAVWRDTRDALRSLRGAPGFTTTALVLFAFAIGLNTAVFTVINAVLFRPLAVVAPHELAFVSRTSPRGATLGSYEQVQAFTANAEFFVGGAGVDLDSANARIGDEVETLTGERVSANYFDVLGVAPLFGRPLVPALDAAPGAERAIVLSEALWRRHFNADPAVIGKQIPLGTTLRMSATAPRYTIVGVIGSEFTGVSNPWTPTEYWVEFTHREDDHFGLNTSRTRKIGMVVARTRPGVTLDQVQAFADASLTTVSYVDVGPDPAKGGPDVSSSPPAQLPFGGGAIAPSRLAAGLMLVAGLVLAIGVANLAGLLMTRSAARRRDVAIRLTLGATRTQITRQLVTETLLLAVAGGLAGVALSRVFVMTLLGDMAEGFGGRYSRLASMGVPVDRRVILFTMLVCVATGLAVSLGAVRRTRSTSALLSVSASESLGAPTGGRWRRRHWILVPQLALSLALLLVALTAVRALMKVAIVPTGYEPHRAAYVTFERLVDTSYFSMSEAEKSAHLARVATFPRRLLAAAEAASDLEATAIASALPTAPSRTDVFTRESLAQGGRALETEHVLVTSGYFRVMGIPLLQGRVFDDPEVATGRRVAVVDESLAARLWPGQSAIGKSLATYRTGEAGQVDIMRLTWSEVVGVVGAIRGPLSEGDTYAFVYLPWPERPVDYPILVSRGRGAQFVESLRDLTRRTDANFGVLQTQMVSQRINERRYPRRLAATLLGFCALGGMALAASGLYGVLSYAVAQRRRELGIRAALGAGRRDIVLIVLKEGAAVAGIGSIVGIPLALFAIQIASHYVLPIPAVDVITLVIAPLAVGALALAACYLPARRAARVDPIDVLRAL